MKQLLQSEFNKGGKIYKNISSPETSGTQTQVTNINLSDNILKLSTDNGATFIDVATQQGNSNKSEIGNLVNNNINIKNANKGFSAGEGASATGGGAIGIYARATTGGAVGKGAMAGDGFSGGRYAQVGLDSDRNHIDAIQLGEGTNNTPKTLQVYTHKVYDSTKDSLYGYYLNDKTPAVIETVWSGELKNDGSTTITVSNYSQYDYFILYGSTYGQYCNIIANNNGTYSFTKYSETGSFIMVYSFVYTAGSFTWGEAGYYTNGDFTFKDSTGTSSYDLYKIEGVKICKA